jgi:hypothetical protein
MANIRSKLRKIQQGIDQIEQKQFEEIRRKISWLQYDLEDVLGHFPPDNKASRQRLMVFLEYEEINADHPLTYISEGQYACHMYPNVVLAYLHYLLDEVGVPPVDEIAIYREFILKGSPELAMELYCLEIKWRQFSDQGTEEAGNDQG